jgi:hypothetical protein
MHSVWCSVVGGLDTLDKMEKIETNRKDRPKVGILKRGLLQKLVLVLHV